MLRIPRIRREAGRPKSFKATGSVVVLTLILAAICTMGYYRGSYYKVETAYATDKVEYIARANEVEQLRDENQVLSEKLERSSKVVTTETTRELVRYYIRKYFPQSEWANAEAIAKCESGLNPQSLNDKNTNGSADRGVWQINTVHAKRFQTMYAINWELGAHDIDMATRYAKFLYDHSGWNPWVCRKVLKG